MEKINWVEFKKGIEENEEEISFYFHDNEWWISRLYGEPRSFLLTRSKILIRNGLKQRRNYLHVGKLKVKLLLIEEKSYIGKRTSLE
ncbi:hypothetical protein [Listeria grayi]|uniref:hypothetical protein n=1 Tax=Listeria grayi TaxID=1641 RepID=UPI00362ABB2B